MTEVKRIRILILLLTLILLGGCSGGGGSDNPDNPGAGPTPNPTPVPSLSQCAAPGPDPEATPLPGSGPTYYFADCQAGADAGCVAGDNANAGTSAAAPKRDLGGFDVNALPAGTRLLFARGGAWSDFNYLLNNRNATPSQPLVFDSYTAAWGSAEAPLITTADDGIAFLVGYYQATEAIGGYILRNLTLDGGGTGRTGIVVFGGTRNTTIENLEITGFHIAIQTQQTFEEGAGVTGPIEALVIRNCHIHHNSGMGILGDGTNLLIECNTLAYNNFSGSGFNHGIYLGGHGTNGTVRANSFLYNSVPTGGSECTGGNLTIHGQWDGLLIENNLLTQDASVGSCYGISITPGYDSAEFFRNFIVRGNTVINLGGCAICVGAAVEPIVEENLLINENDAWMSGVVLMANVDEPGRGGDDIDYGAIVRDNTMCFAYPRPESQALVTQWPGDPPRDSQYNAAASVNNVLRTGDDAFTGPCVP